MADSTPFEDSLNADTAMVLGATFGPALPVVLVVDGVEHPMQAILDAPEVPVTPGPAHAGVIITTPRLHIPLVALQNAIGRPLCRRDGFIVRGKRYRVEAPQEDGAGMVAVRLVESDDA